MMVEILIPLGIYLITKYMTGMKPHKPTPGRITSPYGYRNNPYPGKSGKQFHGGIDIADQSKKSQPVYATYPGVVKVAANSGSTSGLRVWVHKDNTNIYILYAHLSKVNVRVGQKVNAGDLLGYTGNSGAEWSGIHLHYAERVGGMSVNFPDRNPVEIAELYK